MIGPIQKILVHRVVDTDYGDGSLGAALLFRTCWVHHDIDVEYFRPDLVSTNILDVKHPLLSSKRILEHLARDSRGALITDFLLPDFFSEEDRIPCDRTVIRRGMQSYLNRLATNDLFVCVCVRIPSADVPFPSTRDTQVVR